MSTQEQEPRMNCVDCDYSLCEGEFNSGKGRIMFNDVNDDGTKYRCGCCDDRVADPQGMFPDEEEEVGNCGSCDKDLSRDEPSEIFTNKMISEYLSRDEPSEIFTNKMISELTEEELEKEAAPYMRLFGW